MSTRYLLDNGLPQAEIRFRALSQLFDHWTWAHLEGVGIGPGWACWEVGAGGPNLPNRLIDAVGPRGRVLATDIDTSWAQLGAKDGVDILRHDVATEPPCPGAFDLVHARLVLVHVSHRHRALRNLFDSLKPGGWLVIEDADPMLQPLACPDELGPEQVLANKVRRSFRSLMKERQVDLAYGRTLPRLLRQMGLADVMAEAFFPVGGAACAILELATMDMLADNMVAAGELTRNELDRHGENVAEGRLDLTTAPLVTAWGRKPDASPL